MVVKSEQQAIHARHRSGRTLAADLRRRVVGVEGGARYRAGDTTGRLKEDARKPSKWNKVPADHMGMDCRGERKTGAGVETSV